MQRNLEFAIVDVFAEAPRSGNQLAVVSDAEALSDNAMQSVAREFGFSETTFVCGHKGDRAQVRIFTPGEELPFAGHPTLGTAWTLTGGTGSLTLELAAGDVPVTFADGVAWMVPPRAEIGATLTRSQAAAIVGLSEADIAAEPPPAAARCGPLFRLIGVRSLEALQRARMDIPASRSTDGAVFVYCRDSYSEDGDFAARMLFFDGSAVREDPATGSANAALAAYFRRLGHSGSVIVEQGFEIGRPSRIYLEIGPELRIGGRVMPFARGTLAHVE